MPGTQMIGLLSPRTLAASRMRASCGGDPQLATQVALGASGSEAVEAGSRLAVGPLHPAPVKARPAATRTTDLRMLPPVTRAWCRVGRNSRAVSIHAESALVFFPDALSGERGPLHPTRPHSSALGFVQRQARQFVSTSFAPSSGLGSNDIRHRPPGLRLSGKVKPSVGALGSGAGATIPPVISASPRRAGRADLA